MRQAWPFLLSKSVRQDYFTVLCPKYIIDNGLQKAFRTELNRLSVNETVGLESKLLEKSALGKLTIFYRCDRAQAGGIDLRDAHDRPFVRVYGIVVKGLHRDLVDSVETRAECSVALKHIEKAFGDLCANPGGFDTRLSAPIPMPGDGLEDSLPAAPSLPIPVPGNRSDNFFLTRNRIITILIAFFLGAGVVYLSIKREVKVMQTELKKTRGQLEESVKRIDELEDQNGRLKSRLERLTGPAPLVAPPPSEGAVPNRAPLP